MSSISFIIFTIPFSINVKFYTRLFQILSESFSFYYFFIFFVHFFIIFFNFYLIMRQLMLFYSYQCNYFCYFVKIIEFFLLEFIMSCQFQRIYLCFNNEDSYSFNFYMVFQLIEIFPKRSPQVASFFRNFWMKIQALGIPVQVLMCLYAFYTSLNLDIQRFIFSLSNLDTNLVTNINLYQFFSVGSLSCMAFYLPVRISACLSESCQSRLSFSLIIMLQFLRCSYLSFFYSSR